MSNFNRWWFMPFGILATSAVIALSIIVFEPSFINVSYVQLAQRTTGEAPVDCSGASANDYSCYQERYKSLVRGSGVEAAFTDLKSEYDTNQYVKVNCHQLTHVIGRAAANVYGDIPTTYSKGDNFCWSGYYHGAMEAAVAKIGPDEILNQANTICSDFAKGEQRQSFYHYNCVHGLGHGFMGILENELFDSLETCDTITDQWERESCYGGVFMENVMAKDNPSHPSKYLKADQPLYPCTAVEDRYKSQCYGMQTSYALEVEDYDFKKVFDLCGAVEDEFRSTCYQSLGRDASGNSVSDVDKTNATCMLGEDYDARSNCVIGAVKDFISFYHSDTQARELCESFEADLRDVCVETAEDYYKNFQA